MQKINKDIMLIKQNVTSSNDKMKRLINENVNMYKILAEQKKKNQIDNKELLSKNIKTVLDNLLKDKLKKISNEIERLGELYDVKIRNLTSRIN